MSNKKNEKNKKSSANPVGNESLELELRRLRKELEAKDFKILVLETTIKKAGELYGVDLKKKVRHEVIQEIVETKSGTVQGVCNEFNISRQAYYQSIQAEQVSVFSEEIIILKVKRTQKDS